jgi:xyloglucan-specific exo-beta-1,4-glucanase
MGSNEWLRWCGERLAASPEDTPTLLFGSRNDGLWRSPDGGKTWAQVGGRRWLGGEHAARACWPEGSAVELGAPLPLIHRRRRRRARAQASFPTRGQGGVGIVSVLFHPTRPSVAFAAAFGGGVFRSDDGGATWARLGKAKPRMACRMALDAKTGDLYVTTRNKPGVLKAAGAADGAPAAAAWRDVTPRVGVAVRRAPFCGIDLVGDGAGGTTVGVATCELDSAPGGRNSQVRG